MKSLKELLEVREPIPYRVYCDMDGVLTDFHGRFQHFSGMSPDAYEKKYGKAAFWNLVDKEVGIQFWARMEWMKGGKELWNFIKPYHPTLLTSPSKDDTSRLGKNIWVKDHIQPAPKVIFAYSEDKHKYATPLGVLIDDKKSNIEEWRAAGGIGLRCVYGNIAPVIKELKKLGFR